MIFKLYKVLFFLGQCKMGLLSLTVKVQQAALSFRYLGFGASYDVVLFFVELGKTSLEVGALVL